MHGPLNGSDSLHPSDQISVRWDQVAESGQGDVQAPALRDENEHEPPLDRHGRRQRVTVSRDALVGSGKQDRCACPGGGESPEQPAGGSVLGSG